MSLHATVRRPVLDCERLEARETPAGNVLATMSDTNLFLSGDAAANSFRVTQDGVGDIFVTGLSGTTINGQTQIYIGRGTLNGLWIDTKLGNDYVEIIGVATPGWVWVDTGAGSDGVYLGSIQAAALHVDTMGGNDGLVTTTVNLTHYAELLGGDGSDGWDWDGLFAPQVVTNGFEAIH